MISASIPSAGQRPGARLTPNERKPVAVQTLRRSADRRAALEQVRDICAQLGFSAPRADDAATVVDELARNALEHAGCGEVRLYAVDDELGHLGLRIEVIDPGSSLEALPPGQETLVRAALVLQLTRFGIYGGLMRMAQLVDAFRTLGGRRRKAMCAWMFDG